MKQVFLAFPSAFWPKDTDILGFLPPPSPGTQSATTDPNPPCPSRFTIIHFTPFHARTCMIAHSTAPFLHPTLTEPGSSPRSLPPHPSLYVDLCIAANPDTTPQRPPALVALFAGEEAEVRFCVRSIFLCISVLGWM